MSNNSANSRDNNSDYNSNRRYQPVTFVQNEENLKWDSCNLRQEIASYTFNVGEGGFISAGGRAQVSAVNTNFTPDKESNPLNLINNK